MKKKVGKCNTCQEYTRESGSILCEYCNGELIKRMRNNARDVDCIDEDRLDFLLRVAKEMGLKKSEEKIKRQYRQGYGDDLILRDTISIWAPKGFDREIGTHRLIK